MIAKQSLLLLLLLTISHVHCESSSSSSMPQTLQYEFSASLVAQHMHSNATRCFSDTQHNLQRALDRFQLDITPLSRTFANVSFNIAHNSHDWRVRS
jgi:hypothetical protein